MEIAARPKDKQELLELIKEHQIEFLRLSFTDINGKLKGIDAGRVLYVGDDLKVAEDANFNYDDDDKTLELQTGSDVATTELLTNPDFDDDIPF